MNKSGLILRLTVVVLFATFAIGLIFSQVFFRITYINELETGKVKITQLYKTVSSTASIATYLIDNELINEVISGLISNDIVKGVSISTEKLTNQSKDFDTNDASQTFPLYSPFEQTRQVGSMTITPNIVEIEKRATKISWDNQVSIAIQATIIVLVIIIVSYIVVTQPIISIAKRLHQLKIGSEERIQLPSFHNKSEIGLLVEDINVLLERTEKHIGEERKLRLQVEKLSRHFKLLFENSSSPIVLTEPNGDIVLYNSAFTLLLEKLAMPLKQNFGTYLKELFDNPSELEHLVENAFNNNEIASGELKLNFFDHDKPIWVQAIISATVTEDFREFYQITLHDISQRRLEIEQLDKKAHTDQLTQLLNRRGAKQKLIKLINNKVPFSLLLLDLNRFKPINDIYGHEVGDEILNHVATQLTKALRRRDVLSRWGGDEFVVILPELSKNEVLHVSEKIIKHIEKPYFLPQSESAISVGASIGATFYNREKTDINQLIKEADTAMYHAKESKEKVNAVVFYDELS
ncbi:MAG: diguanylate cyclase domain-containing protein [Thalassotalea sp.]